MLSYHSCQKDFRDSLCHVFHGGKNPASKCSIGIDLGGGGGLAACKEAPSSLSWSYAARMSSGYARGYKYNQYLPRPVTKCETAKDRFYVPIIVEA